MIIPRVIPVLLVSGGYLVKPVKFSGDKYIGDPINAVRIFNEKQVDELVVCDIDSTPLRQGVNYGLLEEIASEAFMPVSYGGGITDATEAARVTNIGIEKVILNTAAFDRPDVITEISTVLGSSSTVVSIDAKKKLTGGWDTYVSRMGRKTGLGPAAAATLAQERGAGEILVSSIDRESTFDGYDLRLITEVSHAVSVPVIALGGASTLDDFRSALGAGASAAAAGSTFVMTGKHRAVLINYPSPEAIATLDADV